MPLRAVTFDVYSALFDTVSGLAGAVADLVRHRAPTQDPRRLAQTWREKQAEYLLLSNSLEREGAHNRTAIETSARFALRQLIPPLSRQELKSLAAAWERVPAWPETVEVLGIVRAKPLILATLSNGDEDMLRPLVGTLGVKFDHHISTQGAKFKPHRSIYERTLEVLGVAAGDLLHVAGSGTDAMGATAAGIRTLWINRSGEPVLNPNYGPSYEGRNLKAVFRILETLGA
ncbi:MAG: HAD-IA family hydrolase [bacterium]